MRENLDAYRDLYITSKVDRNVLKIKIDNIENDIQELQKKCESLTKDNMQIINKILELHELSVKIAQIQDDKKAYTIEEVIKEYSKVTILKFPLFNNTYQIAYAPEIKKD